jgi:hypothetical protein
LFADVQTIGLSAAAFKKTQIPGFRERGFETDGF